MQLLSYCRILSTHSKQHESLDYTEKIENTTKIGVIKTLNMLHSETFSSNIATIKDIRQRLI